MHPLMSRLMRQLLCHYYIHSISHGTQWNLNTLGPLLAALSPSHSLSCPWGSLESTLYTLGPLPLESSPSPPHPESPQTHCAPMSNVRGGVCLACSVPGYLVPYAWRAWSHYRGVPTYPAEPSGQLPRYPLYPHVKGPRET